MKYILCVILMYILMCPGYVMAMRAPSGVDAQGTPVYEDDSRDNIVIDNTQRPVRLPPALSNYSMPRKNSNLPEDIQGFSNTGSDSGSGNKTGNNSTGNSQDLPDELKGFYETGGTGQNSTGTNLGATPGTSAGNNMSVSTTGSVSTTAGMPETKTDNTFTVLWFIMACLGVALVITVLYMLNIKKDKSSSTENF